jgi:2,4-dienoyl-CoA reductase-like NADH-dependent reductase (Old Yellow Enzyme family)
MSETPVHLFSPLELRGVRLRNRVAVSPMCMYACEGRDGMANDWHVMHLGARAVGGAALVFTEAAAVEARGRISPEDLGIWDDRHVEPLARVTRFIAAHGAVPGIQLAHAGRKGSVYRPWGAGRGTAPASEGGWTPVAPSPISFGEGYATPQELDAAGIAEVVAAFRSAAARALEAGFRVAELHAAHGYLIHQFLSPRSNRRSDAYGGSLANRMRLCVEAVDAIRSVWPEELPLFVRVSASEWADPADGPAWDVEQTVELARVLRDRGVDVVDCSSGGNLASARIPEGPGYQVDFAARVRREAGVRTAAVGRITEPAQADTIVRSGQADLVLLARAMLRDPNWALQAARALGLEGTVEALRPPHYERAWRR